MCSISWLPVRKKKYLTLIEINQPYGQFPLDLVFKIISFARHYCASVINGSLRLKGSFVIRIPSEATTYRASASKSGSPLNHLPSRCFWSLNCYKRSSAQNICWSEAVVSVLHQKCFFNGGRVNWKNRIKDFKFECVVQ